MDEWEQYAVQPEEDWDKYAVKTETPKTPYQGIEPQNIFGQIFNVPAAALRSAIIGKGYAAGALNPDNVPSFQNMALDSYYSKTPDFPGKTLLGNVVSAGGLAADTLTNPANILMGLAPKLPVGGGKDLGQAIANTEAAKSFQAFINKDITKQDLKNSLSAIRDKFPRIMNKEWLVNQARNVKSTVDETVTGYRETYGKLFEPFINETVPVDDAKGVLGALPKSFQKRAGLTEGDVTLNKLWDIRDDLLGQISDGSWQKSAEFSKSNIGQKDLKQAAEGLKNLVRRKISSIDKDSAYALEALDQDYTQVMQLGRKITKTVYDSKSDTYKTRALISAFKSPDNAGVQDMFDRFRQFNDKIGGSTKNIEKYIARQKIKGLVTKGALGLGLGYGGYEVVKGLTGRE